MKTWYSTWISNWCLIQFCQNITFCFLPPNMLLLTLFLILVNIRWAPGQKLILSLIHILSSILQWIKQQFFYFPIYSESIHFSTLQLLSPGAQCVVMWIIQWTRDSSQGVSLWKFSSHSTGQPGVGLCPLGKKGFTLFFFFGTNTLST